MDYVANGHTFAIPSQLGKPAMPPDFKTFADSMPPGRVEITTANTVTDMVGFHKSRVVYFSSGGEYRVNDSVPVGGQVCVASHRGFVSVMGNSVEPASERLIPPNGLVVLTRVAVGLWLISKGSGGVGSYFNEAAGGAVTTYASGSETWMQHTFTSSGTFSIATAMQPFKVRLIGKGGRSGYADCPLGGGGTGGGGGGYEWTGNMNVGSHAVTVGVNHSVSGVDAQSSEVAGVGRAGGGGNGTRGYYNSDRSPGTSGTRGGTSNGTGGDGSRDGGSAGFRTLWDGQSSNWGQGAINRSHAECGFNEAPANGVVAITYQIG